MDMTVYAARDREIMKEKLQNGLLTLRRYWQRPKKGEEVAYKEIAAFRRELDEIAATGAADGKSEREIKREIDERKRMKKEEKRAAVKAAFEKMRADQKALNRRKKRFCADWIAQAKAEGKKKWLHVLAREAFSRELAREADLTDDVRAENGGSA